MRATSSLQVAQLLQRLRFAEASSGSACEELLGRLGLFALSSSSLRLRIFSSSIVFSPDSIYLSYLAATVVLHVVAHDELVFSGSLCDARRMASSAISGVRLPSRTGSCPGGPRNPVVRRTLTFTHTGFGRLLGDRLVREQTQPDLAAALDETRHRDTAGFDLAVGDVAALHRPSDRSRRTRDRSRATPCRHAAALLLAILDLLWHQHNKNPLALEGSGPVAFYSAAGYG